jgi:hypothetical protein
VRDRPGGTGEHPAELVKRGRLTHRRRFNGGSELMQNVPFGNLERARNHRRIKYLIIR